MKINTFIDYETAKHLFDNGILLIKNETVNFDPKEIYFLIEDHEYNLWRICNEEYMEHLQNNLDLDMTILHTKETP